MKKFLYAISACGLVSLGVLISGCETDSSNTVIRNVDITVEGYYSGSPIVSQNTGASITSLNLRQTGDQLEAIDNNNSVFSGTIGQVTDSSVASFTITGLTTVGNEATISGSITVSGSQATMNGTWIEDSLYGSVYATATVPTNSVPETLTIRANPNTGTIVDGGTITFTASGGNSTSYSWSLSEPALGSPDVGSGSVFTYTANEQSGDQTITVEDASSSEKSVTVSQNN